MCLDDDFTYPADYFDMDEDNEAAWNEVLRGLDSPTDFDEYFEGMDDIQESDEEF